MKKHLMVSVGLVVLAILIVSSPYVSATKIKDTTDAGAEKKGPGNWYDDLIFKDKSFIFEFIRAMGYSYEGGADIGESIDTARRIKDGDAVSWYDEWLKTAERLFEFAQKMEKEKDTVAATEAYLRASNYYRSAGFFMRSKTDLPKALVTWKRSKESFLDAIALMPNIEVVKIPYENTTLPGYFMSTTSSKEEKPPLLIVHTGFDGTGEELYFAVGLAAVKRGYNCLIFEGPGQGEVIRMQKLPFRYDWEKVVTPVVDYALTRPYVDPEKIALMGISMGGYLAPRAVAFEHRIKACIANGGVYDFSASLYKNYPPDLMGLLQSDSEKFNSEMEEVMKQDTEVRWFFSNGMWTFNAVSPADFAAKIKKYTLEGVVKQIKCTMLVIDSEADMFLKGQAQRLYDELDCPKKFITFTGQETAQAHCQAGATAISNEIIFNWLDKVFEK